MTAAVDKFSSFATSPDGPFGSAEVVTPSDTVDLANVSSALYIGVTGDVAAIMLDGSTATFKAVPVGLLRIRVSRVKSTGTTATNMVSLS